MDWCYIKLMMKKYIKKKERERQLMKATVLAEISEYIHFHRDLSAPAKSTDMSQVGVALFP